MRRWRAISAAAAPMCASVKPSRAPRARRKEAVMSSRHATPSRRVLLQSGLAGGLVLAFQWPLRAAPVNEPAQVTNQPDGQFAPNAFIRVDKSGKTTLVMPQCEMGQGVYTAIAMILAEELDADFARVVIERRVDQIRRKIDSRTRLLSHQSFVNDPVSIPVLRGDSWFERFHQPQSVAGAIERHDAISRASTFPRTQRER